MQFSLEILQISWNNISYEGQPKQEKMVENTRKGAHVSFASIQIGDLENVYEETTLNIPRFFISSLAAAESGSNQNNNHQSRRDVDH